MQMPFPDFDTSKSPTLFHYCSTASFLSIVAGKALWLSDINTMNDSSEMHWAYARFIDACNLVLPTVGEEFLDKVDNIISSGQLRILPLLASFSTDGDVLSQWRAYADDGAGVAVGFDSKLVSSLSVRIADVDYSSKSQVERLRVWLLAIHEVHQKAPNSDKDALLFEQCAMMGVDLAFFKNPAFQEEREVRIVRAALVTNKSGDWHLRDGGGSGEKKSASKLAIFYRAARNGGIVAHVALPLAGLGKRLVREVVLGPKSPNNGVEISMALSSAGLRGVKIRRSQATYR